MTTEWLLHQRIDNEITMCLSSPIKSFQKELYTDMPVMWLILTANRNHAKTDWNVCQVYQTLTKAGETELGYIQPSSISVVRVKLENR